MFGKLSKKWVIVSLVDRALHWFMNDKNNNNNKVILSFDLSQEEFKQIPQPNDPNYKFTYKTYLGTIQECLCIFGSYSIDYPIWQTNSYNVNPVWVMKNSLGNCCLIIVKWTMTMHTPWKIWRIIVESRNLSLMISYLFVQHWGIYGCSYICAEPCFSLCWWDTEEKEEAGKVSSNRNLLKFNFWLDSASFNPTKHWFLY